ncbi:MAG TPA: protein kinase [Gammaproteobacteria bacterium]|nr:protein kinase [Gammaproteobacteria bacterium]
MSDTTRQREADEHNETAVPHGARAGPARSDETYADRRLVAERYIRHSRPGPVPESGSPKGADSAPPTLDSSTPAREHLIADRYRLGPRIGSGRFGPIFSAEDLSAPEGVANREVALQRLWGELGKHDWLVEQFEREFFRLRAWRHDNIVDVLDFGRDGDGYFWTTALLEGASLRSIVDELSPERLDDDEARAVILAVGEALQYAHARRKVHGAIDLENVFVTTDFVVKVLDFAAIAIRGAAAVRVDHLTSGAMAARTTDDVYGLACLSYELLSGRHPYGGSLPDEARDSRLKPARIAGLPRKSWNALRRGLALVPEQRTRTVGDFLNELGIQSTERLRPPEAQVRVAVERETPSRAAKIVVRSAALLASAGLAFIAYAIFFVDPSLRDATSTARGPADFAAPLPAPRADRAAGPSPAAPVAPEAASIDAQASSAETTEARTDSIDPQPDGTPGFPAASEPLREETALYPAGPAVSTQAIEGAEPAVDSTAVAEPAPSEFEFATTRFSVVEDAAIATLAIRRTGSTSGERSLTWWTIGDTAADDEDFARFGARVEVFGDGETSRLVHVPLVVDAIPEPTERFFVGLSYDSLAGERMEARAEVVILDDDS